MKAIPLAQNQQRSINALNEFNAHIETVLDPFRNAEGEVINYFGYDEAKTDLAYDALDLVESIADLGAVVIDLSESEAERNRVAYAGLVDAIQCTVGGRLLDFFRNAMDSECGMTCSEVEDIADLLRMVDLNDAADGLIVDHMMFDDEGDQHMAALLAIMVMFFGHAWEVA